MNKSHQFKRNLSITEIQTNPREFKHVYEVSIFNIISQGWQVRKRSTSSRYYKWFSNVVNLNITETFRGFMNTFILYLMLLLFSGITTVPDCPEMSLWGKSHHFIHIRKWVVGQYGVVESNILTRIRKIWSSRRHIIAMSNVPITN